MSSRWEPSSFQQAVREEYAPFLQVTCLGSSVTVLAVAPPPEVINANRRWPGVCLCKYYSWIGFCVKFWVSVCFVLSWAFKQSLEARDKLEEQQENLKFCIACCIKCTWQTLVLRVITALPVSFLCNYIYFNLHFVSYQCIYVEVVTIYSYSYKWRLWSCLLFNLFSFCREVLW